MGLLWNKANDLTITKVLRFQKGATMLVTNTDNSISTVDLTEVGVLDVVPGTATASKAVVLDASKGVATITSATITTLTSPTVNATNIDAGASGAAGTVDIFPTTALKGKLTLSCADQTGDTAVTVTTAAMAAARTLTIPDPGAAASFVMTEGAQTLNGVKTIATATVTALTTSTPIIFNHATGITAFATGGQTSATALTAAFNNITTCATAADSVKLPTAALGLSITVRNSGAAALAVFPFSGDAFNSLAADLSIDIAPKGQFTFRTIDATTWYIDEFVISQAPSTQKGSLVVKAADSAGNTVTTVTNASQAAARTYTIPDAGASASFAMTEGTQTLNGVKTFGGGIAFGAASTLKADSAAVSATGNDTTQTATVTKMAGTITTGSLTTAANATTAVVLTLTGVVAGDLILVTLAGGTNTTSVVTKSAIATTDTITVVLRNDVLVTTALNGTVKFHYLWIKQ